VNLVRRGEARSRRQRHRGSRSGRGPRARPWARTRLPWARVRRRAGRGQSAGRPVLPGASLSVQKERRMQSRLPHWLSAAFVAGILLSGAASAQVSMFTQGPGLSPEDNRLLFESIARLNAAKPARVGNSEAWSNPQTNTPVPTLCSGCFARAAWPATWYGITSSPAEQAATTASLGALRRAANGRSKPDPLRSWIACNELR
jgi:hypothetical protein